MSIECLQCKKQTTNPKFCSSSCSATYSNSRRKRTKHQNFCICGKIKSKKGKLCKTCRRESRNLEFKTKGEIFNNSSYYHNNRSKITNHARRTLNFSNKIKCCKNCGYDRHVECCHIIDVKNFDEDVLISEINSLVNLIWLCPNCHWEFDNGILTLRDGQDS